MSTDLVALVGGPSAAPTWTPAMPANAETVATQRMPPRPRTGQAPLLFGLWCAFIALVVNTRGLDSWIAQYSTIVVAGAVFSMVLIPLGLASRLSHLADRRIVCAGGLAICLIGSPLTMAMGDQTLLKPAASSAIIIAAAIVMGQALAAIFTARTSTSPDWRVAMTLVGVPLVLIGAIEPIYRSSEQSWWNLWSQFHLLHIAMLPFILLAVVLLIARVPSNTIRAKGTPPLMWTFGSILAVVAMSVPVMYTQTESSLVM
ncbi:hypothetical protein ACFVH4_17530 [Nocardia ignorata]|uniref:hypothetical protein n=1 Tax=Nocardia ignorata TaxID=145285 RepID=UPI003635E0E5